MTSYVHPCTRVEGYSTAIPHPKCRTLNPRYPLHASGPSRLLRYPAFNENLKAYHPSEIALHANLHTATGASV